MAQIQLDWYDSHAAVRLPQLLEGIDPDYNTCATVLSQWDFESQVDDVGAAVWAVFQGELIKELLIDDLNEEALSFYLAAVIAGRSVLDTQWHEFTDEPQQAVRQSLDTTCTKLTAQLGEDASQWKWGRLHRLQLKHSFAEGTDMLSKWNMPDVPQGGSHNTVNQSGYSWHKDDLQATWIASIRVVTPMSDPGKATFVYPGGQSGHPGHPQYKKLFEKYVAGEQVPFWFHDDDDKAHETSVNINT